MKTATILEDTVIDLLQKISVMNDHNKIARPTEQQLWEELVACILGSRVVFETSYSAFKHLKKAGYTSLANYKPSMPRWQKGMARELNRSLYLPLKLDGSRRKYPFPFLRSKHIVKTWKMIYGNENTLTQLVSEELESKEKRVNLINNACGIGPKQASLFLRNSILAEDVAILDSHVLRYMIINKLAKPSLKAINSLSIYERIEERLQRYAESLRNKLSDLDLAIWITMRVYHGGIKA